MKTCTRCRRTLPTTAFYFNKVYRCFFAECMACNNERRRLRRAAARRAGE